MRIMVIKAPRCSGGLLKKVFGIRGREDVLPPPAGGVLPYIAFEKRSAFRRKQRGAFVIPGAAAAYRCI